MASYRFSSELPSLKSMEPRAWVDAMHALRGRVADAAATILDTHDTPESARPELKPIFDAYTDLDINGNSEDRRQGRLYIEIKINNRALVFWVFPTQNYESIVYNTTEEYWWVDHDGADDAQASTHELHQRLILRLLEMIPWADDDNIAEIAAIEAATRAG